MVKQNKKDKHYIRLAQLNRPPKKVASSLIIRQF